MGALKREPHPPQDGGGRMSRSVALVTFDFVYPCSLVNVFYPSWFRGDKGKTKTLSPGNVIHTPLPKIHIFFSLLYFLVPVSWGLQI